MVLFGVDYLFVSKRLLFCQFIPFLKSESAIMGDEPMGGIEPPTSSLPRKCSTTELQRRLPRDEEASLLFFIRR